jgi:hypothetical protein
LTAGAKGLGPRFAILAACLLAAGQVWAIDYRSVSVDAAILYDAPSTRAQKLFILGGPGHPRGLGEGA